MPAKFIRQILLGVAFLALDAVKAEEPEGILIAPHYATFETDVNHLITTLLEKTHSTPIYLCDTDVTQEEVNAKFRNQDRLEVVKPESILLPMKLAKCNLVIIKGRTQLHTYRFLDQSSFRSYIRLHHGILTKNYKRLVPDNNSGSFVGNLKKNAKEYYLNKNIDIQPVASDVERYFRSSAENRHPQYFKKIGYPRFDRIREFIDGDVEPDLPAETLRQLKKNELNVLYVPTHKVVHGGFDTTVFPLDDFNVEDFGTYILNNNISIFIRMHPNEEDSNEYKKLFDKENFYYAGQGVTQSPIEFFPYIDVILTDYSSIYIDSLPFDVPIMFVQDSHDQFRNSRGLAYDYNKYFPGRKVRSTRELKDGLKHIKKYGQDGHEEDREFVRRVFLPEWERPSTEEIINRYL